MLIKMILYAVYVGMLSSSFVVAGGDGRFVEPGAYSDELLKKDILRSKIEAHQLIEIKSRLISGDVEGAERFVDAFLDMVYQELSVLRNSNPGKDDGESIDDLLMRINGVTEKGRK